MKINFKEWYLSYLYCGAMGRMIHFPIRYLFEEINDHGVGMNSPELIPQAIDSGYIKPFAQRHSYDYSRINNSPYYIPK